MFCITEITNKSMLKVNPLSFRVSNWISASFIIRSNVIIIAALIPLKRKEVTFPVNCEYGKYCWKFGKIYWSFINIKNVSLLNVSDLNGFKSLRCKQKHMLFSMENHIVVGRLAFVKAKSRSHKRQIYATCGSFAYKMLGTERKRECEWARIIFGMYFKNCYAVDVSLLMPFVDLYCMCISRDKDML